jgi:hypothetical protein
MSSSKCHRNYGSRFRLVQCGSRESTEYILGLTRVEIRASKGNTTTGQHMLLRLEKDEDVTYYSSEQTLVASKC